MKRGNLATDRNVTRVVCLGGRAPALADDLAHVLGGDVQVQLDPAAALLNLDRDGVGVVHDVAHHVLEDGLGCSAAGAALGRVVDLDLRIEVAHVEVLEADLPSSKVAQVPVWVSSLRTRSVGWAPLRR